jgi:hypothetical protein
MNEDPCEYPCDFKDSEKCKLCMWRYEDYKDDEDDEEFWK